MSAILMAAAMAVSAPGASPAHVEAPPPPPDPAQAMVHPVQAGESLSRIAQCELGDADRWAELFELNRNVVTDPNLIVEGWELALPEPGTGDCPPVPEAAPAVAASSATSSSGSGSSTASSSTAGTTSSATSRQATAKQSGTTTSGSLDSIRQCESSGDYGAVSASGTYRGAYQFDQQTWESVGGSGDPAAASAAEQDQRAAALMQQRGSQPWPNCG